MWSQRNDPAPPHKELQADDDARALLGSTIAGRYRIKSLLGQGAMGAVYLVQHTGIRKRMALKVLQRRLTHIPELVARFEREAMAAAHIGHPNVVEATDFGRTDDGRFYLALEYVDGKSLREALRKARGPMPPERAFAIARQITGALTRAHEMGIVHRDLKPENIMLTKQQGYPDFVKVLDFGLALLSRHITDDDEDGGAEAPVKLTKVGDVFGTPAYMAPEQSVGDTADIRSDLYSLGIVLYEMLAGARPFPGRTTPELIQQHLLTPPPLLKERKPPVQVSEEMEALVQRLLAKRPAERFQTPQELLTAIEKVTKETAEPRASSRFSLLPAAARERSEPRPLSASAAPSSGLASVRGTLETIRGRLAPILEKATATLFPKPIAAPTPTTTWGKTVAAVRKTMGQELPAPVPQKPRWLLLAGVLLVVAGLLVGIGWLLLAGKRDAAPTAQPETAPAATARPPAVSELPSSSLPPTKAPKTPKHRRSN